MDAIVQLVRNGLCCIKDLNLFAGTSIHDNSYTFDMLPPPLNETTPLEFAISLCQLYAVISLSVSGFNLIFSQGLGQFRQYKLYKYYFRSNYSKLKDNGVELLTKQYINEQFDKQITMAKRNIICGLCVFSTGIAFFWLFLSSLHSTENFGGLPAVIHALTVAEVGLFILLHYMLIEVKEKRGVNRRINSGEYKYEVAWYLAEKWSPFWISSDSTASDTELEKAFEKEVTNIKTTLQQMQKEENWTKECSVYLRNLARKNLRESYITIVYFILNAFAFYGYGLCVICYYYPDSNDFGSMKFYYKTDDADWWGNFVGDFCWTIEPIVIMLAPFWICSTSNIIKTKELDSSSSKKKD